jgi:hypothetical protein
MKPTVSSIARSFTRFSVSKTITNPLPPDKAQRRRRRGRSARTLPAGGTDVPFTFKANGDAIILQIFVDNHPSEYSRCRAER